MERTGVEEGVSERIVGLTTTHSIPPTPRIPAHHSTHMPHPSPVPRRVLGPLPPPLPLPHALKEEGAAPLRLVDVRQLARRVLGLSGGGEDANEDADVEVHVEAEGGVGMEWVEAVTMVFVRSAC